MLILCLSKYIKLASCVHNSTHCILWSTHIKYIMHFIMYTRVQNAFWCGLICADSMLGKTICDLKCKLTANQNVFVYMKKACCVLQ